MDFIMQNSMNEFLTQQQAAKFLQVSVSWLRQARMKKNLSKSPPFTKAGNLTRYPRQGLINWVMNNKLAC